MKFSQKVVLTVLRVATGWFFLYAGITKVLDPTWSAEGYLSGAQTFSNLYGWLALPSNIGWVNFLNEWGLTLIGAALILGICVRWAAYAGVLLMLLYWFPVLNFPYVGDHSYVVDDHIIYTLVLFVLAYFNAGRYWGIDSRMKGNS